MKKSLALLLGLALACCAAFSQAADKTYNTDIAIVGGGAGGLTAGVAALDAGFKIVILEKMPTLGGSGNYMEGTFAVGSKLQKRDNVGINPERQFKKVMAFHHWRIDANDLNNWLKQSAGTIDWLMAHGVHFTEVRTAFIDGTRTWHMFPGGHGSSMVKIFVKNIQDRGGTILTETPAKSLIMKNGRVVGVEAVNADGDKVTVYAKDIIIATGGFSGNKEMIKKYLPYAGYQTAGSLGRTGDGIKMLQSAGAELRNMNVCMQAGLWLKGVSTNDQFGHDGKTKFVRMLAALFQPYLKVSPKGARVCDENLSLEFLSNAFEEVGGEGFAVFDENTKEEMEKVGLIRGYFGMVPVMTKFDNFDQEFNEGIKDGFAFKANTLAGLAKETGMDPKELEKSAADMNKFTEAKYDSQFYKDSQWLRSVKRPPFYAIKGSLRMYATTGGARVNTNFQAMTAEGKVIPGLYAIGQDAGGMYGDSYDMHIAEGTASSWAINGGRLSVAHIAATWKGKK
jgi:fumarate reductase flavoprotein subunit